MVSQHVRTSHGTPYKKKEENGKTKRNYNSGGNGQADSVQNTQVVELLGWESRVYLCSIVRLL